MTGLQSIEWRVAVDSDETTAIYEPAENERAVFVCAHGAGGHLRDRSMENLARVLREGVGMGIVRFNFPYKEHGSRRPDPMSRLKQCMTAVIARTREELQPRTLIIGGRSMGGRVASMLAAESFPGDGLLLFAYPLHPAGKPEKLRDAHLPQIRVPVLGFNGTRDALCRRDLMEPVVASLAQWLNGIGSVKE